MAEVGADHVDGRLVQLVERLFGQRLTALKVRADALHRVPVAQPTHRDHNNPNLSPTFLMETARSSTGSCG